MYVYMRTMNPILIALCLGVSGLTGCAEEGGKTGNSRVTIENLEVVRILPEEGVLVVKGAVPGHKGAFVVIRKPNA